VRQINGLYRVKEPGLKPLHAAARARLLNFTEVEVTHIRRTGMTGADKLAKLAAKSYAKDGRYLTSEKNLGKGE